MSHSHVPFSHHSHIGNTGEHRIAQAVAPDERRRMHDLRVRLAEEAVGEAEAELATAERSVKEAVARAEAELATAQAKLQEARKRLMEIHPSSGVYSL